jgi:hypothetical protein
MGVVQGFLTWLASPAVVAGATLVIVTVWRFNPKLVNEAAAWWTMIGAIVAQIAKLLVLPGGPVAAMFHHDASTAVYAVVGWGWAKGLLSAIVFNGIIPWLTGYGAQRGGSNILTFASGQGGTVNTSAPVQSKAFQTKV